MAARKAVRFRLGRPRTFPQVALAAILGASLFFALSFFASRGSWVAAGLGAVGYGAVLGIVQVVLLAARRYNENTERVVRGR